MWIRLVIILAGFIAGFLAILVFYLIVQKFILAPVRDLTVLAEDIAGGNLSARAADQHPATNSRTWARRSTRCSANSSGSRRTGDHQPLARYPAGRTGRDQRRPVRVQPLKSEFLAVVSPRTPHPAGLDHRFRRSAPRFLAGRRRGRSRPVAPLFAQHPGQRPHAPRPHQRPSGTGQDRGRQGRTAPLSVRPAGYLRRLGRLHPAAGRQEAARPGPWTWTKACR